MPKKYSTLRGLVSRISIFLEALALGTWVKYAQEGDIGACSRLIFSYKARARCVRIAIASRAADAVIYLCPLSRQVSVSSAIESLLGVWKRNNTSHVNVKCRRGRFRDRIESRNCARLAFEYFVACGFSLREVWYQIHSSKNHTARFSHTRPFYFFVLRIILARRRVLSINHNVIG